MGDKATGKWINNAKSWLTDQSYTGGHGEDPNGVPYHNDGPHNNYDLCTKTPDWTAPWPIPQNAWTCAYKKHPWAFPGDALSTEKLQTTASQAQCAFQTQTSIAGPGLTAAEPSTLTSPRRGRLSGLQAASCPWALWRSTTAADTTTGSARCRPPARRISPRSVLGRTFLRSPMTRPIGGTPRLSGSLELPTTYQGNPHSGRRR